MPAVPCHRRHNGIRLRICIRRHGSFSNTLGAVLGSMIGVLILISLLLALCRASKSARGDKRSSVISGRDARRSRRRRAGKRPGTEAVLPQRALKRQEGALVRGLDVQERGLPIPQRVYDPPSVSSYAEAMVPDLSRDVRQPEIYLPMVRPIMMLNSLEAPQRAMSALSATQGTGQSSAIIPPRNQEHTGVNVCSHNSYGTTTVENPIELRISIETVAESRPTPPKPVHSNELGRFERQAKGREEPYLGRAISSNGGHCGASNTTVNQQYTNDNLPTSSSSQEPQKRPTCTYPELPYSGAHLLRTPPPHSRTADLYKQANQPTMTLSHTFQPFRAPSPG